MTDRTVAEVVGGLPAFRRLINDFYERVEQDPPLRAEYPEDLTDGKEHLALFFAQYWGAGPVYSERRGHPRLRMRHAPFNVSPDLARRWAGHMQAAVLAQPWPSDAQEPILAYIAQATPTLINDLPTPDSDDELPTADA